MLNLKQPSFIHYKFSQVNEKTKEESVLDNQISGINEDDSTLKLTNASKEYSVNEKIILDLILTIINAEKGIFELKTERLSELKKGITASIPGKTTLNKDEIIQFLKQTFDSSIKLETNGNKCFISKNLGGSLFNSF